MLTRRQEARLRGLQRALRESPIPKAFTMGTYVREQYDGGTGTDYSSGMIPEHWCGTPACVLGHYAARRDIQRAFTIEIDSIGDHVIMFKGKPFDFLSPGACKYFGLDTNSDQLYAMFGATGCGYARTPAHAIAYINKVIAKKKASGVVSNPY